MSIFDINDDLFAHSIQPDDIDDALAILGEPYNRARQLSDGFTWEDFSASYRQAFAERDGFIFRGKEGMAIGVMTFEALLPSCIAVCIHGACRREFWGKGYARDVMCFVKKHLFSIPQIHKIEITEAIPNLSISNLARRSGFKLEANIENRSMVDGQLRPMKIYGLTREEHINAPV